MRVDYTPYEGFVVKGYPETVVLRGRVVVDRKSQVDRLHGEYVSRN
jgi:dihydropyrimidinase